jgi:hypothetical protein
MSATLPVEITAGVTVGRRKVGSLKRIYAGTSLRVIATFRDSETGQPVDVSSLSFLVRDPTGDEIVVQSDAIANLGLGVFAIALALEVAGTWTVVARCSLPSHAVAVTSFDVTALPAGSPPSAVEYMTTADGRFVYMTADGSLIVKPA